MSNHRLTMSSMMCAVALAVACGRAPLSPGQSSANPSSMAVVATQSLVPVGEESILRVLVRESGGAEREVKEGIVWLTSATDIVDVSAQGVVTGVAAGRATITASWQGLSASVDLTAERRSSNIFVRGRVRDFLTGSPRAGVAVRFDGAETVVTDVNGIYSLWLTAPGTFDVTVGTNVNSVLVTVDGLKGDFLLDGTSCVARYGRVVDAGTGIGVPGVAVELPGAKGTTLSDGSYRLDLGCPSSGRAGFNTTLLVADHVDYEHFGTVVGRGVQDVRRMDIALRRR